MSEASGPMPPEEPKQEPTLQPTEAAQPPRTEAAVTPDARAETAALAELQTLRAQYTDTRAKAQLYIDWRPQLVSLAKIARDAASVYGKDGPTAESLTEQVKMQTYESAFRTVGQIAQWVERGEQRIAQIDYLLANPNEAQAMDVGGLTSNMESRINKLERFFLELRTYESTIGSPPDASPVVPAAEPAKAPASSPETTPHPEEMRQARALRESFRQLSREIQKYWVEIRFVEVRSTTLAYPQGKILTEAETNELASARNLTTQAMDLLASTIQGEQVLQEVRDIDNFLDTGLMSEGTKRSMDDIQARIDRIEEQIKPFQEHWTKYLPQRQFVRQEEHGTDTQSALEVTAATTQAEAQALSPEVAESIREVTELTQELQELTGEIQRYANGIDSVDARSQELRGIRGRALTGQETQELNSSEASSTSLDRLQFVLYNSGIRVALRSLGTFLDNKQITSQYLSSLRDLRSRIDEIKRGIQQIREHWKNYLPQAQGNFSAVSPSNS